MHGAGTRAAASAAEVPAAAPAAWPGGWVLDLSRLVSRVGQGPDTGIDRVERAYLEGLLAVPEPVFFLIRVGRRLYLLGRGGAEAVLRPEAARPGLADRLLGPRHATAARTRAGLARAALASGSEGRILAELARRLPAGGVYLNVGHANLSTGMLSMLGRAGLSRVVYVHDLIPIDHPGYCRAGTPEKFEARMRSVSGNADMVLCNSVATAARVRQVFAEWGRCPPLTIARPGLGPVPLQGRTTATHSPHPHFVALGTIEPRKNHALLLEVWDRLGKEMPAHEVPHLHIVGRRGWENRDVFALLDSAPYMGRTVFEHRGLDDAAVVALLQTSRGLLFPSLAEGYGFPPLEAARLDVPVFCAPLPATREMLGDWPVYLPPEEPHAWVQAIRREVASREAGEAGRAGGRLPATARDALGGWPVHMRRVLATLRNLDLHRNEAAEAGAWA